VQKVSHVQKECADQTVRLSGMGWVVPGGEANPQGTKYRRFECAAELVASC